MSLLLHSQASRLCAFSFLWKVTQILSNMPVVNISLEIGSWRNATAWLGNTTNNRNPSLNFGTSSRAVNLLALPIWCVRNDAAKKLHNTYSWF
jgi:hypothetical protein